MIFSNVIRVQQRGFELDPAALERIGVFDRSVCWGVWVPDPRGQGKRNGREHLLISPIHPTVWPFLLRMEIKLRDEPGKMAEATRFLVDSHLNIQFAESAISGHHHATWTVVAEAHDVRGKLHEAFSTIQGIPGERRRYNNPELQAFSNDLAKLMHAKAVELPAAMEDAHRLAKDYREGELDCGFLHNRIVDKHMIPFFFEVSDMAPELAEVAKRGLPQAVTCRWIQSIAFFAVYGEMQEPIRLQYDAASRLLKLTDDNHRGLGRMLELQDRPTTIPARAVASFDTAGLYLRVDIIEPADARSRFIESTIDYEIRFAQRTVTDRNDSARGLWLSICEQVADHGIDLVKIANRTTHRDDRSEAGSFTLIGHADTPIENGFVATLDQALRRCRPVADVRDCDVTPKTTRFQSHHTVFVSRRTKMPMCAEIEEIIRELAANWGFVPEIVDTPLGQPIDQQVEQGLHDADGLLQIMSYSDEELERARSDDSVLPDLQWLFHEYGFAIGAGKPHVRIFDATNRTLKDWTSTVGPRGSEAAGSYNLARGGLLSVRESLERAFAGLARQLHENRHAGPR